MREMREFSCRLMQSVEACKKSQDIACASAWGLVGVAKKGGATSLLPGGPDHGDRVVNRADGPRFCLSERCLSDSCQISGGVHQIVQSPGAVSFLYEGWQRVIPITRVHISLADRHWAETRARIGRDTLVVDVSNFTPRRDYQGFPRNLHSSSAHAHRREHARVRSYDGGSDRVEKPWTVKVEMAAQDAKANAIYDEPRCHDGTLP